MKKFLFIFTLIAISVILLLQIDDNLSPEAQAMLDSELWQEPSEAFLYLAAIGVAEDKDPAVEGKRLIAELRKYESTAFQQYLKAISSNDEKDRIAWALEVAFSFPNELTLPKENCCFYDQENALRAAITDDQTYDLSNPLFNLYEQRYWAFLRLGDFHSMTTPSPVDVHAGLLNLKIGNKTALYTLIQEAKTNPALATKKLYELIDLQSRFSGKADHLTTRMVSYRHLRESIDVLSLLLRKYKLTGKTISPLTKEQLDFSNILNREFAYVEKTLTSRISKSMWVTNNYSMKLPNWINHTLLKDNMTLNEIAIGDQQTISLSKSSAINFSNNINQPPKTSTFSFRNFFGANAINERHQTYTRFIGYGFDINAKIALFNATLEKTITPEIIRSLGNPYYSTSGHASLNEEEKLICFDGPIVDEKNYRCLPYN